MGRGGAKYPLLWLVVFNFSNTLKCDKKKKKCKMWSYSEQDGVRLCMLVGFQLDMEIRQNKQQFKYKLCIGGGVDACLFLSVCTPKIRSAELCVCV